MIQAFVLCCLTFYQSHDAHALPWHITSFSGVNFIVVYPLLEAGSLYNHEHLILSNANR